tara:strand:+ start:181 stop:375 length:195 start_codon:yes stop_codon:yes gene_type:complete
MNNIEATTFEDGKALADALNAAERAVAACHIDNGMKSDSVRALLRQIREMMSNNEKRADSFPNV